MTPSRAEPSSPSRPPAPPGPGPEEDFFPPFPLLSAAALTKDYGGFRALDAVDFDLRAGETHVLFGENGAGKSTLISILAGAQRQTSGVVRFRGEVVRHRSTLDARARGVSAVFQEFSLAPQMTVEENIFLGAEESRRGFLAKKSMRRRARELLDRLGFGLRVGARVDSLSRAERQMVEIAKAFRAEPSVLILDEPTASLTDSEAESLFNLTAQLKARGVGVVYITHRMGEIRRVGDRVTVLRDGKFVATADAKAASEDELVRLMTGRVVSEVFPKIAFAPGEAALAAENLFTADGAVAGASFQVRRGEIVGLAGLVGSGKSEVVRACFGLEKIASGTVTLNGEAVARPSPAGSLARGLVYLPPDRREEGLMMMRPCRENISLPAIAAPPLATWGFIRRGREAAESRRLARRFNLTPPRPERPAELFSGGNQQKIMLAKCLAGPARPAGRPGVFIFDEPTVGVDVGARADIYAFIRDLCEGGAAVALVSSDLPEVLHLSHRLYVFHRGAARAELRGADITEENALPHFFAREAA